MSRGRSREHGVASHRNDTVDRGGALARYRRRYFSLRGGHQAAIWYGHQAERRTIVGGWYLYYKLGYGYATRRRPARASGHWQRQNLVEIQLAAGGHFVHHF